MMIDGKKSTAEKQFYGALDIIQGQGLDPLETFKVAVENAKPLSEVKSRRVGGSNYQVPVEVRPVRRQALAIRWLIEFSRGRGGRSMRERLAGELLDCANKRGSTIKRREDVHKMAEANKAFAHFRW
jgi:small subunit ribosomal protein S7